MNGNTKNKWKDVLERKCAGLIHPDVIETLIDKMERGYKKHGDWVAEEDKRDHRQEAITELLDASNYMVMEYLIYKDANSLRLLCKINDLMREIERAKKVRYEEKP